MISLGCWLISMAISTSLLEYMCPWLIIAHGRNQAPSLILGTTCMLVLKFTNKRVFVGKSYKFISVVAHGRNQAPSLILVTTHLLVLKFTNKRVFVGKNYKFISVIAHSRNQAPSLILVTTRMLILKFANKRVFVNKIHKFISVMAHGMEPYSLANTGYHTTCILVLKFAN